MSTYVITEACISVKDATCVDVCPAACIHTTPDSPQYYIDPEICIACEQCFFVCPVDAIFKDEDVPEELQGYLEVNAAFFRENKPAATTVTLDQAQKLVDGVRTYATGVGYPAAVAVVDAEGFPIATFAMDGATGETTTLALNKAYTAALLQVSTHQMGRGANTPVYLMPDSFNNDRMVTVSGGYPLMDGANVIGAIGVAGGPSPQHDLQCVQAGMAALYPVAH